MRFNSLVYLLALVALFCIAPVLAQEEKAQPSVILPPDFQPPSPELEEKAKNEGSKFTFGTEVNRLMKLIVNSLYKTKEIFLRELISNGSDALDKIRFLTLTNSTLLAENPDMKITIVLDKVNKTMTITDTGVGMTREDLRTHLGTIAKSGTAEFAANDNSTADAGLIGQFGVGFYSVFLVADHVTVISKHTNDTQHIWESNSESEYTIYEDPRGNTLGRGTQIILHLKDEAKEYAEEYRIQGLIKKYSEFIHFPIYLWTTRNEPVEVPVEEEEEKKSEEEKTEEAKPEGESDVEDADKEKTVEDVKEEEKKPKTKTIMKPVSEWKQINENTPIWTKNPKDITDEEYDRFYQKFTSQTNEAHARVHFKGEGEVSFTGLLYFPPVEDFSFWRPQHVSKNIKLYVRRVLITEEIPKFMPRYLAAVQGVIDSDDLPLNVSRETLQQNGMIKMIKKKVVSKLLETIKKLSEDYDKYAKFYAQYGTMIKFGLSDDQANAKKLQALLRFNSSATTNITSFDQYIDRMRKGQKQIYFLTGNSLGEMKSSPFVEKAVSRGYEVLFMTSPLDEYVVQSTPSYRGYTLQSVAKEGLKYGDEEEQKEAKEKQAEKFKPLIVYLENLLKPHVEKVVLSDRLVSSPCVVVAQTNAASGVMEKIIKSERYNEGDQSRSFYMLKPKVFEINPEHPVIAKMLEKMDDPTEELDDLSRALFEASMMRAGYEVSDQKKFFGLVESIVRKGLGVDLEAKADVEIKPAPEPETPETKEHPPEEPDNSNFFRMVDDDEL